MAHRIEFSRKQRTEIHARAKGCCEQCHARLKAGEGEYDHVIPYAMTRETTVQNGQLLCNVCHSNKTNKHDKPAIAKAQRVFAKHIGVWPKPIGNARMQSRGFDKSRNFNQRRNDNAGS